MIRFVWICLVSLVVFAGSAFAAPAGMPAQDYQALESAIINALNRQEAADQRWVAPSGASGVISTKGETPRRRWPGCSGASCDDICRRYDFTYKASGKSASFDGVRCRAQAGSRNWKLLNERFASGDVLPYAVAAAPARVTQDPVIVAAIQRGLSTLLYYDGAVDGDFGPGAKKALDEFMADYRHTPVATPDKQTQSIVEAAAATTLGGAECDYVSGVNYGVCGRFN